MVASPPSGRPLAPVCFLVHVDHATGRLAAHPPLGLGERTFLAISGDSQTPSSQLNAAARVGNVQWRRVVGPVAYALGMFGTL
jgi:hypothetical protein